MKTQQPVVGISPVDSHELMLFHSKLRNLVIILIG